MEIVAEPATLLLPGADDQTSRLREFVGAAHSLDHRTGRASELCEQALLGVVGRGRPLGGVHDEIAHVATLEQDRPATLGAGGYAGHRSPSHDLVAVVVGPDDRHRGQLQR